MIPTITVEELELRLLSDDTFVLLDVRQPEEHAETAIPLATLIPLGVLPVRINELEQYRNREIIVYCKSGGRSAQAVEFLRQKGLNAINVAGGITAWNNKK